MGNGNCGIAYHIHSEEGIECIYLKSVRISYPLHNHISTFIVGVLLDGTVEVEISGRKRICGTGDVFLIRPYEPHSILARDCYSLITLCLDRQRLGNWQDIHRKIYACLTGDGLSGCSFADYVFDHLDFNGMVKDYSPEILSPELKKRLEKSPETEICIDEMAGLSGISKYHFIKKFKQEVGMTPHQFLLQNRIRKAQRLLQERKNIAEVALESGFCDQSHFSKCFVRAVGITPALYRACCYSTGKLV